MGMKARRRERRRRTWTLLLLRLYPRAWRERYADEVAAVLEQRPSSPWTLIDVLAGACDAHLHRDLLPERLVSTGHRIRNGEIAVFCAFVLFCFAWAPIQRMRDPLPVWESVVRTHPEILAALNVVNLFGVLASVAILVGGLPILYAALRSAAQARRWKVLLLFGVPFALLAVLIVYMLLASRLWTQRASPGSQYFTPLAAMLQLGFFLLFLLVIIGSVAAVAWAVTVSDLSERVLRFALFPAAAATLSLAALLLATAVLAALTVSEAPEVGGPWTMGVVLAFTLAAAAVSFAGLKRGWSAARM